MKYRCTLCCFPILWQFKPFLVTLCFPVLGCSAWNMQSYAWKSSKMSLILNTKPTCWKVSALKISEGFSCLLTVLWVTSACRLYVLLCLPWKLTVETEAATADEALKREQFKTLQMLVNKLNECRKVFSFPSQIITESLYWRFFTALFPLSTAIS